MSAARFAIARAATTQGMPSTSSMVRGQQPARASDVGRPTRRRDRASWGRSTCGRRGEGGHDAPQRQRAVPVGHRVRAGACGPPRRGGSGACPGGSAGAIPRRRAGPSRRSRRGAAPGRGSDLGRAHDVEVHVPVDRHARTASCHPCGAVCGRAPLRRPPDLEPVDDRDWGHGRSPGRVHAPSTCGRRRTGPLPLGAWHAAPPPLMPPVPSRRRPGRGTTARAGRREARGGGPGRAAGAGGQPAAVAADHARGGHRRVRGRAAGGDRAGGAAGDHLDHRGARVEPAVRAAGGGGLHLRPGTQPLHPGRRRTRGPGGRRRGPRGRLPRVGGDAAGRRDVRRSRPCSGSRPPTPRW